MTDWQPGCSAGLVYKLQGALTKGETRMGGQAACTGKTETHHTHTTTTFVK